MANSPVTAGWFVYILRCADGSLYTGITTDVERRLAEHNGADAPGARYTRGRRPVDLVHVEPSASRSDAARREGTIKRMRRDAKLALIEGGTSAAPEAGLGDADASLPLH